MPKRLFTFFAFFIAVIANAQQNNQPPEQLHLHLDKDIYLPGEIIWFKAYLYNGTNASTISTNLYAALYNEQGKLLQQKQYPIFEGSTNGEFIIPDTIADNNLQLLIFTRGMRQHDSTSSYYRRIAIINTAVQSNIAISEKDKMQLQFFAEGGTAIAGVTNYYVYKAWFSSGQPAQIKGAITETGNNAFIDSFYTNEQGLGSMQFTPIAGKSYQAVWAGESEQQLITLLPETTAGAALHTEIAGNTLYYVITKNSSSIQNFTISIHNTQTALYTATVQMNEANKYAGKVPVDSLTQGLVKITLQDDTKKMLEERMVLINPGNNQTPITHSVADGNAKAKNVIEITLPDTLLYNMSAAVADINFYDSASHQNIQNSFWLNGNTTIPVNSPFADWLLQAKSHNKYNFTTSALLPADNYLTLSVNYKEKKHQLPNRERLNLVIKDSIAGNQFYDMEPTTPNSFIKPGLIFYDSAKIFYKTTLTKELENYINLQRDEQEYLPAYITPIKNTVYSGAAPAQQKAAAIDSFINGITHSPKKFNEERTLNAVTVKSRKWGSPETRRIMELDEKYTTGLFSGIAKGYQINVLDDEKAVMAFSLVDYLVRNVPRVLSVCRDKFGNRKLYACGCADPKCMILVFVNETELPEQDGFDNISVPQIAYMKYVPGIVIGSSFTTTNGAIYIYLKKGDEPQRSYLPEMRSKIVKGYDLPKQFTSPDYTKKENLQQQDRRITLYWNPYLTTEADKKTIKIEYYNNDISKRLLLTIEGINEEGRLIHIEKVIE